MKQYIFMTANIYPIGGMQNYVAGKVRYLREHGWDVHVFFAGANTGSCALPILNDFTHEEIEEIFYLPGTWNSDIRNRALDKMISHVNKCGQAREIIIESHSDVLALWGELLAEKLSAKHMCFSCNEVFEGRGKYYKKYLDFFSFKHTRKELLGIHTDSLVNLFGEYKTVAEEERYVFYAAHEDAVQDVELPDIKDIEKCDWSIGFIGRADKLCDEILDGIARFCLKYSNKSIAFIMIGRPDYKEEDIYSKFSNIQNLKIRLLGDQVPIPRDYFKVVDVVIAGSGCAECAAREGTPTIVTDANNGLANGILGHTVFDDLFSDSKEQMDYLSALEQVLVHRIHEKTELKLPDKKLASEHYAMHMKFVAENSAKREFYTDVCTNVKTDWHKVIKYYIRMRFPFIKGLYNYISGNRKK